MARNMMPPSSTANRPADASRNEPISQRANFDSNLLANATIGGSRGLEANTSADPTLEAAAGIVLGKNDFITRHAGARDIGATTLYCQVLTA